MSEPPVNSDPTAASQGASDQRRGAFVGGGTFNGPFTGYQENHQHYHHYPVSQPTPPMPLDQALALLASLPAGSDDPIPLPDAFQTSDVPRLIPLTPNDLFIGRDSELRDVAGRLKAGEGVVIATGMGGVGKTQLAVELAHRYGRYFGGGVFWLDASTPARLADSIAACGLVLIRDPAFGTQPRAEQVRQVEALWADALPRLLIFDNGDDPALVGRHRPPAGGCRVLVTSRTRRWPAGEGLLVRPLDVLERAQSVALLHALAARLSEGEAGEIAEELGDLPLALHLAGSFLARSPSVKPAAFRERVRARTTGHPALQGHGDASAPTYRQQQRTSSLEAVFQISLERLDPHDPLDALARTLLARAAGLREPGWPFLRHFLVDTAPQQQAADPDLPPPAEEAVERLLQLGLLEAESAGRLRLHRLLASFARTALDGPEVFAAFAPIAFQWVISLISAATDLWPVRAVEGRLLLDSERPLWEQFLDWGYVHEQGSERCMSARTTALLRNYWVLNGNQEQVAIYERLQRALAAAKRLDDLSAQTYVLKAIGDVQQHRDEQESAMASYGKALELYRAIGDPLGEANTLFSIGDMKKLQGEMDFAMESYGKALELYRATGDSLGEANTLASQSEVLIDIDLAGSQKMLEASLVLHKASYDTYSEAVGLGNYGLALLQRGRGSEALTYLQRARAIFVVRDLTMQVQWIDDRIAEAQAGPLIEWFNPLLQAIMVVALGDKELRAQIEAELVELEQRGFMISSAVHAIWTGQRDLTVLTVGLDDTDTELIRRVLAMLDEAETTQDEQHAALLARAQAAVAAASPDPAARAALADRLRTTADAYTSGSLAERALAAQLRALAAQLGGEAG